MFSGIVEKKSVITSVHTQGKGISVVIQKPSSFALKIGDSVAVDGICSTVASFSKKDFTVSYMEETLLCTTAQFFNKNRGVNLEQSIRYGDRVHGHLVQGHVSSVARVEKIDEIEHAWNISIHVSPLERRYIVYKGSITINGISLTIAKKTKNGCIVSIIPHTLSVTTLGSLKKGDIINIETDFLLRAYLKS
jgi:riboflavin synthase